MDSEKEKKKQVIKITHAGELLLWLVVIMVIVGFASISFIKNEKDTDDDYRIFLSDANGLIVGSPVRMMGIEVGHVTKIKPMNNEVYVRFIITNPEVYVPVGTAVTVEFSGMAGSKSLELYLPDKDTYIDYNTPVITVLPPKRLNESVGLLNEMYNKFMSIIYTSSSFGKKLNKIEFRKGIDKNLNLKDFLIYSDEYLNDTQKIADDLKGKLEEKKNGK